MCAFTIKQRNKLKHKLNMSAMSTYPRLPFRSVPLTLTLRKPTHPHPIPIFRSPFHFPSSSSSLPSCSNNKMSLSCLLSPLPVSTSLPKSPSSSSSTLPPTPSLSPCPPPRQFRDDREYWEQGSRKTEGERQQQRQLHRERPYEPHMVQQKTTRTQLQFKIGLQDIGGSLRKRRVKQSIITPFKPPISPRSSMSKKKPSAAVVTAAAAAALLPQEDEIDLEALTYYPPAYTSEKETETGTGTGGGGGEPEPGYGSKPLRPRTKLRVRKKKRDRSHYRLQEKQQRALHFSDVEDRLKSRNILSRDDHGLCFVKRNFSSTGNAHHSNTNNREGDLLSRTNTTTLATGRPRTSSDGLPMPLKKRFMVKDSLL